MRRVHNNRLFPLCIFCINWVLLWSSPQDQDSLFFKWIIFFGRGSPWPDKIDGTIFQIELKRVNFELFLPPFSCQLTPPPPGLHVLTCTWSLSIVWAPTSLLSWKIWNDFDVDWAVGFDRAEGAVESNCPLPSKYFMTEVVRLSTLDGFKCWNLKDNFTYTLSHRECGQFRPYDHENFEKIQDNFDLDGQLDSIAPFGVIESNCPSRSKLSWIFQIFHDHRDGTVHTVDETQYKIRSEWKYFSLQV